MENKKTIGDVIDELVERMRGYGVSGVYILESALLQLTESKYYLLTADHQQLSTTAGYAKLQQQDAELLARIDALLAKSREVEERISATL